MNKNYFYFLKFTFLGWIIVVAIFYLAVSFSYMDLNPINWAEIVRKKLALAYCITFLFQFMVAGFFTK